MLLWWCGLQLASLPSCPHQEEVASLAARRQELLQQLVAALGLDDAAAGRCILFLGMGLRNHAMPGSRPLACKVVCHLKEHQATCRLLVATCVQLACLLSYLNAEAKAIAALQQQIAWRDEARGTGGGSLPLLLLDDPRQVLPSARKAAAALEGLLMALHQQVGGVHRVGGCSGRQPALDVGTVILRCPASHTQLAHSFTCHRHRRRSAGGRGSFRSCSRTRTGSGERCAGQWQQFCGVAVGPGHTCVLVDSSSLCLRSSPNFHYHCPAGPHGGTRRRDWCRGVASRCCAVPGTLPASLSCGAVSRQWIGGMGLLCPPHILSSAPLLTKLFGFSTIRLRRSDCCASCWSCSRHTFRWAHHLCSAVAAPATSNFRSGAEVGFTHCHAAGLYSSLLPHSADSSLLGSQPATAVALCVSQYRAAGRRHHGAVL